MSDRIEKIAKTLMNFWFFLVLAFILGIALVFFNNLEWYTWCLIFIPLAIFLFISYANKDDIKTTFFKDRSRVNFREINNDEV